MKVVYCLGKDEGRVEVLLEVCMSLWQILSDIRYPGMLATTSNTAERVPNPPFPIDFPFASGRADCILFMIIEKEEKYADGRIAQKKAYAREK